MKYNKIYRAIAFLATAAVLGQLTVACNSSQSRYSSPQQEMAPAQQPLRAVVPGAKQLAKPASAPVPRSPTMTQDSSQKSEVPDASNREAYDRIEENPFLRVSNNPLSAFSIDVDAASYSNVRRFINEGKLPPKDAVRIEELINYFPYEYPQPEGDRPFSVSTEISQAPWNPDHRLVHIGLQGKKISTENLPPSNLVFLLDASGSMNEPNKLPLVKSSLRTLAEQLSARDRVAIVTYAGTSGLALPSTPGDRKDEIIAAVDNLEAGGST